MTTTKLNYRPALVMLLAGLLASPLLAANLNKSIKVEAGSQTGSQTSVNGSIRVGSGAIVDGNVNTVNGTVTIEDNARVGDAETVNGSIRLHEGVAARNVNSVNGSIRVAGNVVIDGDLSVVNGKISTEPGSSVSADTGNVNGEILIDGTELGGNLTTVNGDIELTGNTILRGDLVVEKPGGWGWNNKRSRKPRIVIGPGVQVLGDIRLEREVELFISESATVSDVTGEMSLDDAVRFSGQQP